MIDALLYFPSRPFDDLPGNHGLAHEDVEAPTADGEKLHGWWIAAPAASRLGHLIHFHGNAGNISHRLADASALSAAGFDVLLFDYRGYGRSTGRPREEGLYQDARAVLAAVSRRRAVDPSRLFYLGESLGGAVALALALERPPRGLVLQSTFTGIRDLARRHYAFVPSVLVPDAYSSLRRIAALRAPLLVVHGERDEIVPLSHGQRLFAAAPEPKRWHPVANAGHNDLLAVAGTGYAAAIAAWAAAIP